ncbi:Sft1p [Sporobolomyces salmoneus]|uniref:Sft1p n=1 Tax=Sporobolomyces salmoneus TaxID=183962 RepID=UPI003170578A
MSSWGRPSGISSSQQPLMSKQGESSEQDLESQNDQHLDQLHSKIAALRGVTTDIYNDSRTQNSLLDSTGNSFDSFKNSLSNTSTRFARSVQSGKGNGRIQLGIVLGFVGLFLLWKLARGGSSTSP